MGYKNLSENKIECIILYAYEIYFILLLLCLYELCVILIRDNELYI